mgnify:CR=1 FL=1
MTVIERKVQLFGISRLAKLEDSTRSWDVYRQCTFCGLQSTLFEPRTYAIFATIRVNGVVDKESKRKLLGFLVYQEAENFLGRR